MASWICPVLLTGRDIEFSHFEGNADIRIKDTLSGKWCDEDRLTVSTCESGLSLFYQQIYLVL
jgi:hypothetical protein